MEVNIIHNEDCLSGLGKYPDRFFHCCVTSPPYWRLRDYENSAQIGQESSPGDFVEKLSEIFRQVHRVMRDDGTVWVNIGDTYFSGAAGNDDKNSTVCGGEMIKHKELIGIPWMLAFRLRKIGFYLRQDIIWHKPNPMPESVKDRCTKSHEYIFLLTKSPAYYYNQDAVGQLWTEGSFKRRMRAVSDKNKYSQGIPGQHAQGLNMERERSSAADLNDLRSKKANLRSVWTIAKTGYRGSHFAAFPDQIPDTCIRAGCPENGIVLDPFMGAGTTAVAAGKLNRKYVGFEVNSDYVNQAQTRIRNELGLFH